MASNPYELRQGLLGQAQQILVEAYHSEVQRCRDQGVSANHVKFPSTEDIIAEAEKLYSFVQKK